MAVTGNKAELGQMNLATLKRFDTNAVSIIDKATQVALYKYSFDLSEWEKPDIQGTFFIYERSGEPSYSCLVLNRLNMNNLTQPLTSDLQFSCQSPFLLYRNGQGEIFCLWFFYDEECTRLLSRMEALCSSSEHPQEGVTLAGSDNKQQQKQRKQKSRPVDLLSLITANKGEKSGVSSADSKPASVAADTRRSARTTGPGSNPPAAEASGTITVHDLFAKASQLGQGLVGKPSDRTMSVSEVEDSMSNRLPLQRLMSQPPPSHPPASLLPHLSASRPPHHLPTAAPPLPPAALAPRIQTSVPPPELHEKSDVNRIHELFSGGLQQRLQSTTVPPSEAVPGTANTGITSGGRSHEQTGCSPNPTHVESSDSIALMSPMMFTAPTSVPGGEPAPLEAGACSTHADPVPAVGTGGEMGPEPLTARQLAQALTFMLKNDEGFVEKLHQAYVKSLSARYKWS